MEMGGGPRVVVSTAAFHAKMFLPHPRVKVSIVGSLRDREVACSASDRQGSNFESCVWRTVSSQSSQHPQEVLLAQFSLYEHKGGLKPDSFHFYFMEFHIRTVYFILAQADFRPKKWGQDGHCMHYENEAKHFKLEVYIKLITVPIDI